MRKYRIISFGLILVMVFVMGSVVKGVITKTFDSLIKDPVLSQYYIEDSF